MAQDGENFEFLDRPIAVTISLDLKSSWYMALFVSDSKSLDVGVNFILCICAYCHDLNKWNLSPCGD